ncbi:hypothetical protein JW948_10855 [bacterium]|nr:hypothetical protein [bacterium]
MNCHIPINRCALAGALLILFSVFSHAQMVGNPTGNQGQFEWSLSCTGSFMNQNVGLEKATSQRVLLKSAFGITPNIDLVAMFGSANLTLNSNHSDIELLESKPKLAYGLGLTFTPKREEPNQPVSVIAGGHILRFQPDGMFHETVVYDPNVPSFNRESRMAYDWREYLVFGGVAYRLGPVRLYGCGVGWGINRTEEKTEYQYETGGTKEFIARSSNEFQSELWTGALAGVELIFPKTRHVLSLEGLFYNEQDFIIMVGIGQTGIVESGW